DALFDEGQRTGARLAGTAAPPGAGLAASGPSQGGPRGLSAARAVDASYGRRLPRPGGYARRRTTVCRGASLLLRGAAAQTGLRCGVNNLAMFRASCKQPGFRNGHEAVQLAEAACHLSGRRNPSFLGTLAAAYAEASRFADAVKTMQEALALAKASGA